MGEEQDLYTLEEAAKALGMSVAGVRLRVRRGDMRARRIGQRVLVIPGEEVRRWKERGKLRPGPKRRTDPNAGS